MENEKCVNKLVTVQHLEPKPPHINRTDYRTQHLFTIYIYILYTIHYRILIKLPSAGKYSRIYMPKLKLLYYQ